MPDFRKLLLTVMILLVTMAGVLQAADDEQRQLLRVNQAQDKWLGPDKAHHFFTSAVMTGLGFVIVNAAANKTVNSSLLISGSVTFSIGALKEIRDQHNKSGQASLKDILANVFGIGFGILLMKTV